MARILPHHGVTPTIAPDAYLSEDVVVTGDVHVGELSSLWFGTVVRGDVWHVRIGARTNVQDGSVVHVRKGKLPCLLMDDVTVGHRAVVHACTVEDACLIGMGSVVLDAAVVGTGSIVAAGAVVLEGTKIPPRSLVAGVPATVRRTVTDEEVEDIRRSARSYVELSRTYLAAQRGG